MVMVPTNHRPPGGDEDVKSLEECMNIVDAYHRTGSYRAAGALCGVHHRTVKAVIDRAARNQSGPAPAPPRTRNTDAVATIVADRVRETDGRISAKRLLPAARAAGFAGSARNFRRAVAGAKVNWRRQRRTYRPWVAKPGEHLLIDWGSEGGMELFCATLPWSRWRFVRFACDQRRETTLRLLAECFEAMGGVPAVVLSDRMACLRGGIVANVVVAHPDYVRFATHYGFRPDFCEAADPESKGAVEALVGYAQRDLLIGLGPFADVAAANAAAPAWCVEVNGRIHSETHAVPAERLNAELDALRPLPGLRAAPSNGVTRKVDRLATIRFGSARYSVPMRLIATTVTVAASDGEIVISAGVDEVARHRLVSPGECAIDDAHYGGARPARPVRAVRARTGGERSFLALGSAAEGFLRAAAAAGTPRLAAELASIVALAAAHGNATVVRALERATRFRRFGSADIESILAAGDGLAHPTPPGISLTINAPSAPTRSLAAYAPEHVA